MCKQRQITRVKIYFPISETIAVRKMNKNTLTYFTNTKNIFISEI